jgi:predicted ester cyclase
MSRSIPIAALLLAACATSPASQGEQVSNREVVRKLYEDCVNTGNVALLPSLIADEYVGPNGARGPAAYQEIVTSLRTGFPDIRFKVEDVLTDGDKVTVRWSWHGTHSGPFGGVAPTRKSVDNTGIVIYQLKGGKIVHAWLQADRLGVLQQIGVVSPDIGRPPTKAAK